MNATKTIWETIRDTRFRPSPLRPVSPIPPISPISLIPPVSPPTRPIDRLLSLPLCLALALLLPGLSLAHVELVYPPGTVTYHAGQQVTLQWDVYIDHGAGTLHIDLSTNGGAAFTPFVSGIPYSGPSDRFGNYLWTVPNLDASDCRIHVVYASGSGDYYNGQFAGQNDPAIAILPVQTATATLQEGLNGYSGTRDATLYEGTNNSNGGGEGIFAGNNQTGSARRALIAFDLSSIPPGSTITSANLQLTVSKTATFTLTTPLELHRLTSDWGEGATNAGGAKGQGSPAATNDATWFSSFFNTSTWTTAGGDYASTVTATASVSNSAVGNQGLWQGPQLTRDIQDFLDGARPNYGWVLIGDEATNQTAIRFSSSEDSTDPTSYRPQLVVGYNLPPPPLGVTGWELF